MGGKMLQDIRQDLTDVVHVCEGKKKQTNDLRTLISDLVKGNRQYHSIHKKFGIFLCSFQTYSCISNTIGDLSIINQNLVT